MSLALVDLYCGRESAVHRLDARVKVVLALAGIAIITLTPLSAWPVYLACGLGVLFANLAAHISPVVVLRRSMLAIPFVLLAAAGMPAMAGRPVLVLPVFSWTLVVTDAGLLHLAGVMARAWLSVLVALTLALTTRFAHIVRAMRSLGVPLVLAATISLMYRYLYVLSEEALRLMRAREARSAELEGYPRSRGVVWRAQVTGRMIGTLFLRTYERSERIYAAMLARGYDGEMPMLGSAPLTAREMVVGGCGVTILMGLAILAHLVR